MPPAAAEFFPAAGGIPGSKKQNTLEALMDAGYSRAQAERIYGVIG